MELKTSNNERAFRGLIFLLVLLVIFIALSNILEGCKAKDPEPIQTLDIKGYWEASAINTPLGEGFAQTYIIFDADQYLFHSNTIIGEINQQGSYRLRDNLLSIELSFPQDIFKIIGKAGSEFEIFMEGDSLMVWEDLNSGNSLIWQRFKSMLENEKDRKPPILDPLPEPPDLI